MKAAVLHTPGQPPRYEDFPDPTPGEDESLVRVRAASLKTLDRAMAEGEHYSSSGRLPAIPGVDGIAMLEDGARVYCGGVRPPYGMMAELAAVSRMWAVPIPDELDDVTAAALPNPAMSSYLPLTWRSPLQQGESVLVLGATGAAGQLAVQIAKHLGAGRVVAAGRNIQVLGRLPALGADVTISLDRSDADLADAFAEAARQQPFDIILDYVWGRPAEVLLGALTGHNVMAELHRMRYIQIGETAGPSINLTAATLRSTALEMYGSGGGGVPLDVIFGAFPMVLGLATSGKLRLDTEVVPLSEIESVWQRRDPLGRRIVVVP